MDRLLRLSGAGMGGMGSGQGATDAPVVDTAEQVSPCKTRSTDLLDPKTIKFSEILYRLDQSASSASTSLNLK